LQSGFEGGLDRALLSGERGKEGVESKGLGGIGRRKEVHGDGDREAGQEKIAVDWEMGPSERVVVGKDYQYCV